MIRAIDYLDPASREYYAAATNQTTIPYIEDSCDMLNDEGTKLSNLLSMRIAHGAYDYRLSSCCYVRQPSGSWMGDRESPHQRDDEALLCLTTHNNVVAFGRLGKKKAITSVCLFCTPTWFYTSNGSLYTFHRLLDPGKLGHILAP